MEKLPFLSCSINIRNWPGVRSSLVAIQFPIKVFVRLIFPFVLGPMKWISAAAFLIFKGVGIIYIQIAKYTNIRTHNRNWSGSSFTKESLFCLTQVWHNFLDTTKVNILHLWPWLVICHFIILCEGLIEGPRYFYKWANGFSHVTDDITQDSFRLKFCCLFANEEPDLRHDALVFDLVSVNH